MNAHALLRTKRISGSIAATATLWALLSLSASAQNSSSSQLNPTSPSPGGLAASSPRRVTREERLQWATNRIHSKPEKRQVIRTGPHSITWEAADSGSSSATRADASGIAVRRPRTITSIASGMNFYNGTQWIPSEPSFTRSADGTAFEAARLQAPVRISAELNVTGAISVRTPDGILLQSTPLAIGLYDAASGQFGILASLTNTTGSLISSNRVFFERAFVGSNGLCADLVYTIERGAFHQDVILRGRFDPSGLGFPTNTSRIQVLTEFYGAPEPERTSRPLYVERSRARGAMADPDLVDDTLTFGELDFSLGRAYGSAAEPRTAGAGAVVAKSFVRSNDRAFLVESIPYRTVAKAIASLPDCGDGPRSAAMILTQPAKTAYASIPAPRQRLTKTGSAVLTNQLASAAFARPGVLIDYVTTIGPGHTVPTVFQAGATYFIEGPVYCVNVVLESAILKYPKETDALVLVSGSLTCKTYGAYPAFLTAADDETIGESLATQCSSTGCISDIWPLWNGFVQQGDHYANPALYIGGPAASLSHLRFRYCLEGVRFFTAGGNATQQISHSQFLSCLRGVELTGPAGSGNGNWLSGTGSTEGPGSGPLLFVNNCLMTDVQFPLLATSMSGDYANGSIGIAHCTFDDGSQLITFDNSNTSDFTSFWFYNCVIANVSLLQNGSALVAGSHNGFWHYGDTQFGAYPIPSSRPESPFQTVDLGHYYLAPGSDFSGCGTGTDPLSSLFGAGASMKETTTHTPISFEMLGQAPEQLNLYPQAVRYPAAPNDLGYYYPALDYMFGDYIFQGCATTVAPGTSVAVRSDYPGGGNSTWLRYVPGLEIGENSSFISHGTPTKPNTFADARFIQEGPSDFAWIIGFLPAYAGNRNFDQPPFLSFRFSNFYFCAEDEILAAGAAVQQYMVPPWSHVAMRLSIQDCNLFGGNLEMCSPDDEGFLPASSASFLNNAFNRVGVHLTPNYFVHLMSVDFALEIYNNLMRGGWLFVYPDVCSLGSPTIKDNLFDDVLFSRNFFSPIDHNNNAYWVQSADGVPPPYYSHLPNDTGDPSIFAPNDKVLTASPTYSVGPFGERYLNLSTSSPLYNSGSRSPAAARLFHATTQLNQAEDNTHANVNIGPHYVASVNGAPKDSTGLGVPDYVSDADGNGLVDASDTTPLPQFSPGTKALNDTFQVDQASSSSVLTPLVNDTDSQGLPFTLWYPAAIITTPHGSVAPSADFLSFLYTPTNTFWGIDTFTYAAVNNASRESSATISVFVNKAGNHPPVASAYQVTMSAFQPYIDITLDQDSDQDGDALAIFSISTTQLGTTQDVSPPSGQRVIRYTRTTSTFGTDKFTYVLSDGKGGRAIGSVQVGRDLSGNHMPVAVSYSTTAAQGSPLAINLPASDADSDPLAYTIISYPQHGTTTGTAPAITYTPASDFYGPDFLVYKVNDGHVDSAPATLTIHVQYSNLTPEPLPQSLLVTRNTAQNIILSAYDRDGDYLVFTAADTSQGLIAPSHGMLSGQAPNLVYTPASGYTGPDSFTFFADDGKAVSDPTFVSLQVIDAPPLATVANNDIFQVQQDSSSSDPENTLSVLSNDTDSEGYALTITSPAAPMSTSTGGVVNRTADGLALTYTPRAGFYGFENLPYTVSNGHGRTASATVTVFVNRTGNSNPTAADYEVTLARGQSSVSINLADLLTGCQDGDGDSISIFSINRPSMGSTNITSTQFQYTRNSGSYGLDTFNFLVTDSHGGYAAAQIHIDQIDSDGDGIPDDWEIAHSLDADTPDDPVASRDVNGLSFLAEYLLRADTGSTFNYLDLPTASGTFSGVVQIPLAIPRDLSGEDLNSPPTELLIDGSPGKARIEKVNGKWIAEWDSQSTPNGTHVLGLAMLCMNASDQLWSGYPVYGSSAVVTVSNSLTVPEISRAYTGVLMIEGKLNVPASNYRIEVSDHGTGEHMKTLSGVVEGGRVSANWNLLDSAGHSSTADSLDCEVFLDSSQQPVHPTPYETIIFTSIPSIHSKLFTVAYGFDYNANMMNRLQDAVRNSVVNNLNTLSDDYGPGTDYGLLPSGAVGNDPFGHAFQWVNKDLATSNMLVSALSDPSSGNFYFWGHGNWMAISPAHKPPTYLHSLAVERDLHNHLYSAKHPYRLVIIDSCTAYSWHWAIAFGIGDWSPNGTTDTVADYLRNGREPQAFVAWNVITPSPGPTDVDAMNVVQEALDVLWSQWQRNIPLEDCMKQYTDAYISYPPFQQDGWPTFFGHYVGRDGIPDKKEYKISGCKDLRTSYR